MKKLYGHCIRKGEGRSLTDQLYSILKKEIIAGRWSQGEKMPSFNDLSDATGMSQYPLQTALDRLEEEGYIRKVKQKGIFISSARPAGAELGVIGLLAGAGTYSAYHRGIPKSTQTFGLWDLAVIQKHASNLGYRTEILASAADAAKSVVSFSSEVQGIISLLPFSDIRKISLDPSLPVAYLGVDDPSSTPAVTGDPNCAMFMLTQKLIAKGHRKIAVFASPHLGRKNLFSSMEGHRSAMELAGLEVNQEAMDFSVGMHKGDLSDVKSFIGRFPDSTAILSMNIDTSIKIVEYADFMGIQVPGELSVASLQEGFMRKGAGKRFLGTYYEWESIIMACFDMLLGRKKAGTGKLARIVFNPIIDEGASSGALGNPIHGKGKNKNSVRTTGNL